MTETDSLDRIMADLHAEADLHMVHYEGDRYLATAESKWIRGFAERIAALASLAAREGEPDVGAAWEYLRSFIRRRGLMSGERARAFEALSDLLCVIRLRTSSAVVGQRDGVRDSVTADAGTDPLDPAPTTPERRPNKGGEE